MNIEETTQYLFDRLPVYQQIGGAAYKANLNNTLALDKHFEHPHLSFKTIHVAGTNGKGSVSHMITSALQEAGYKVGLYTSPHLLDMRERIKVNGEMITKQYVIDFVANNQKYIEELQPSFFELMVLMCFCYFRDQKVDVAIIETGLGGRLDSTNIITPLLSIITNIGLDHTQFLGDSLSQIAHEKAGIIKKDIPVIIGRFQYETASVFTKYAKLRNAALVFSQNKENGFVPNKSIDKGLVQEFYFKHKEEKYNCDLKGKYQLENAATALCSLNMLKKEFPHVSEENIRLGLSNVVKNTGLLGRWQTLSSTPLTLCDTGHNTDGLKQIAAQLKTIEFENIHIVLGIVNDKPAKDVLEILPAKASYYFTQSSIARALDKNELQKEAAILKRMGETYENVLDAWNAAKEAAGAKDCIFIGGSTFIVADALEVNQKSAQV